MRKILLVLGVVPLITGTAMAVQPLNDAQMDGVTSGASDNAVSLPVVVVGGSTPSPLCAVRSCAPPPTPTPTPTPAPTPSEAPSTAYNESHPEDLLSMCLSNCAALAAVLAGNPPPAPPAPPPAPPPTPTQQFSSLLSSNGIGLR